MTKAEYYEKYGPEEGQRRIDAKNAYQRAWLKAHPEYVRNYQNANRKHINAYINKRYHEVNREAHLETMKKFHDTPEGRASNLLASYRQADQQNGFDMPMLTRKDILVKALAENCRCVYCGTTENLGLDRLSRNRGHDVFNTLPCCRKCNVKKNRKPLEEWLVLRGMTIQGWLDMNRAQLSDGLTIHA